MKNQPGKQEKPWIKPLPERVVNKIAAGEVIERPAAVVKELVENSIDAGADRIDIFIEKSGVRLIKIVDNGCGIDEEQVEIAFSRHATSKIRSFDDLNNLWSYGFRGEALPSVASVSRLRMVTRAQGANAAVEIIYEGGVVQSKRPCPAPLGTLIEVENLFFNTPARRKFMKAESTEARHISRTAMALAIGRCDIGFSYSLNGRSIFVLPPRQELKDRVIGVLGSNKQFVHIHGEIGPVKIDGYIGTPDAVQNHRYGQFMFINSRYIYSPTISHALMSGYGELIPRGTFPVGALLLTVDPHEVDVNVHPTKAEVRLSNEKEVHDAVYRIVKESLRQDGIIPIFRSAATGSQSASDGAISGFGGSQRKSGYMPGVYSREPIDQQSMAELYDVPRPDAAGGAYETVHVDKNTGEIVGIEPTPSDDRGTSVSSGFRLIGRFGDLYLLLEAGDDLYIVDQHTAHERVLYEETVIKLEGRSLDSQNLLFPVQVELNPEQLAVFDEVAELLNNSGFAVSHFGGRMVNIEAVPSMLSKKSPSKVMLNILDDVASMKKAGSDLTKAMAQSIACRSAVMAGDRLSDPEATHLLTRLLACSDKYSCPHGRPTFIKVSRQDLDKQFGRG